MLQLYLTNRYFMHFVAQFAIDLLTNQIHQTLWTALQAIGTVAAFLAILWQVRKAKAQTEALAAATGYDLLLRVDDRFNSREMRVARAQASYFLKTAMNPVDRPPGFWNDNAPGLPVEQVLDVFELIGLLLKKRAIDPEAVWSLFSYHITNYYSSCDRSRYFKEWLGNDPPFYEDFKALHARMQQIQRRRTGQDEEPDPDFLDAEIKGPHKA